MIVSMCYLIFPLDLVGAVAIHPHQPLLASCSGQRRFVVESEGESSGEESIFRKPGASDIKVWKIPCQTSNDF